MDSIGQLFQNVLLVSSFGPKYQRKNLTISALVVKSKKIKALSYINYGVFNVIKCLYFFDLATRAEIVKFFRWYFGPNDDTNRTF